MRKEIKRRTSVAEERTTNLSTKDAQSIRACPQVDELSSDTSASQNPSIMVVFVFYFLLKIPFTLINTISKIPTLINNNIG